jgi:hypothetical protein
MEKINSTAHKLKNLHLTSHGFMFMTHSYILASIFFQLYVVEPTTIFFKELQATIKSLLWTHRPKVAWNALVQSPEDAGIGLIDPKTRMQSLHTSLLLRVLFTNSNLSKAISWHFYHNQKGKVKNCFNTSFQGNIRWLNSFFLALPKTKPVSCVYTYLDNRKLRFVLQNPKQTIYIQPGLGTHTIKHFNKVQPRNMPVNPAPQPFTLNHNNITVLQDLKTLVTQLYTTPPPLKTLYTTQLAHTIPAKELSESTKKILAEHHLEKSVFASIWHLKIRPFTKMFMYLFLRCSLPLPWHQACPACTEDITGSHIFSKCPVLSTLYMPATTDSITKWILAKSSIWLTFTKLYYNENYTTIRHNSQSIRILFNKVHQKEIARQQCIQHRNAHHHHTLNYNNDLTL